jgi:hypothetical protein
VTGPVTNPCSRGPMVPVGTGRISSAAWRRPCSGPGLDPEGTFYALRHSLHFSRYRGGVSFEHNRGNCGTSVRIIETSLQRSWPASVETSSNGAL